MARRTRDGLTPRQLEVLVMLAAGKRNTEIARELWISEHTVKFHCSNIYMVLDVRNRTEAVSKAILEGLVVEAA